MMMSITAERTPKSAAEPETRTDPASHRVGWHFPEGLAGVEGLSAVTGNSGWRADLLSSCLTFHDEMRSGRRAAELRAVGLSHHSIAGALNQDAERTADGRRWTFAGVRRLLEEGPRPSRTDQLGPLGATRGEHTVLFYKDPLEVQELIRGVAQDAVHDRRRIILMLTAQTRLAVLSRLPAAAVEAAEANGWLLILDAADTLELFMRDGRPDPVLFLERLGPVVGDHCADTASVSIYCEMVALLWQQGNAIAALEVEQLWNHLRYRTGFDLLCAHPMTEAQDHGSRGFAQICHAHDHVQVHAPVHHGS